MYFHHTILSRFFTWLWTSGAEKKRWISNILKPAAPNQAEQTDPLGGWQFWFWQEKTSEGKIIFKPSPSIFGEKNNLITNIAINNNRENKLFFVLLFVCHLFTLHLASSPLSFPPLHSILSLSLLFSSPAVFLSSPRSPVDHTSSLSVGKWGVWDRKLRQVDKHTLDKMSHCVGIDLCSPTPCCCLPKLVIV